MPLGSAAAPWLSAVLPRRFQVSSALAVTLPVLIEAKLALMRRMHETRTTKTELARMLGISEGPVRRLLRFDHRSHIGRIEATLARLGSRLELRRAGQPDATRSGRLGAAIPGARCTKASHLRESLGSESTAR